MPGRSVTRLLHFFGLGAICLALASGVVIGLSTGTMTGLGRGGALPMRFAEHPYGFAALALFWSFLAIFAGVAARKALDD